MTTIAHLPGAIMRLIMSFLNYEPWKAALERLRDVIETRMELYAEDPECVEFCWQPCLVTEQRDEAWGSTEDGMMYRMELDVDISETQWTANIYWKSFGLKSDGADTFRVTLSNDWSVHPADRMKDLKEFAPRSLTFIPRVFVEYQICEDCIELNGLSHKGGSGYDPYGTQTPKAEFRHLMRCLMGYDNPDYWLFWLNSETM